MKLTIFNVYVPMVDQAQCDRMKHLCIDNDLIKDLWDSDFDFSDKYKYFMPFDRGFYIGSFIFDHPQVTEQQFIELLKEYKLNN